MDLCTEHDGGESEEEDGLQAEEDEEQHRNPWRELAALWTQTQTHKHFSMFMVNMFEMTKQTTKFKVPLCDILLML